MKVLAWYANPNGIEKKNTIKDSIPHSIEKREILEIDTKAKKKKFDFSCFFFLGGG